MAASVSINLSPKKRKKIEDQSGHPAAEFIHTMNAQRAAAVSRWYSQHSKYSLEQSGGNWFLQWVDQNYRRWTGEALRWTEPGLREYYLALGTPWLARLIAEKAAQAGFASSMARAKRQLSALQPKNHQLNGMASSSHYLEKQG